MFQEIHISMQVCTNTETTHSSEQGVKSVSIIFWDWLNQFLIRILLIIHFFLNVDVLLGDIISDINKISHNTFIPEELPSLFLSKQYPLCLKCRSQFRNYLNAKTGCDERWPFEVETKAFVSYRIVCFCAGVPPPHLHCQMKNKA